jgi:hypothetical protein
VLAGQLHGIGHVCVLSANTTAAGGGTVVKADSSRPCCSRTASAVEQRCFAEAGLDAGQGRVQPGSDREHRRPQETLCH